jgi:hypothetical protein
MENSLPKTKEVSSYCYFLSVFKNPFLFCFFFCSLNVPKIKNIQKSAKGDKMGRIHMKKQNLDTMGGRKMSALRGKRSRDDKDQDGGSKKKPKAQ